MPAEAPALTAGGAPEPREGNPVAPADVAAMFDAIAPVYDRLNTMLTLGLDGRWRDAAARATRLRPGQSVLDVASGTGKLAGMLAELVGPFGRVVGIDLSPEMTSRARARYRDVVQLEFETGDALRLPFPDGEFDAATIAFGLRNLPTYVGGFREMARVVRPGGPVVCLELSVPRPRALGRAYLGLFRGVAPLLGRLHGQAAAYRYLPDSLDGFPDPRRLAAAMREAGLTDVRARRLALGAVAIHVGVVHAGPRRGGTEQSSGPGRA